MHSKTLTKSGSSMWLCARSRTLSLWHWVKCSRSLARCNLLWVICKVFSSGKQAEKRPHKYIIISDNTVCTSIKLDLLIAFSNSNSYTEWKQIKCVSADDNLQRLVTVSMELLLRLRVFSFCIGSRFSIVCMKFWCRYRQRISVWASRFSIFWMPLHSSHRQRNPVYSSRFSILWIPAARF